AVFEVTVPTAPSLNVTTLLPFGTDASKPVPLIVIVGALAGRLAVFFVTVGTGMAGITVATWTGAPLLIASVVTTAVNMPTAVGLVVSVMVSDVGVDAVTVPTAPSLKTTVLFPGVGSKPKPLMNKHVPFRARLSVLLVTTGVTVATCTGAPLL